MKYTVAAWVLAVTASTPLVFAQRSGKASAINGGFFEASGVVAVPGTSGVLFVDDAHARHVWWMEFDANGVQKQAAAPVSLGLAAADMEDITTDGTYFYAVASQSKPESVAANGLVRFTFDAATRRATNVEGIPDLTGVLRRRVPMLRPKGRRISDDELLNIEGLTWDPVSKRLLLGLRSPMSGRDALVVALRVSRAPGKPFELDSLSVADVTVLRVPTGGAGIRGLGYDGAAGRVLMLVGPSSYRGGSESSRLLSWDGVSGSASREVTAFPPTLKAEGVTRITIGGRNHTLVVCDSSRYLLLD